MGIAAYAMIPDYSGTPLRAEDVEPGTALLDPVAGSAVTVKKIWSGPGVGMRHIEALDAALDLTGDSQILTESGWAVAERIRPGEALVLRTGRAICGASEPLEGTFMVYDIVPEGAVESCVSANDIIIRIG